MPRLSALRALRVQDRASLEASSYTVAAPVGGLNARDALANMPETDAIILDNWFPQPTWVEVRNGEATLATFTGLGQSLMAYNSLSGSNQLYVGANNGGTGSIYRVDNAGGGAVGAAVVGGAGNTIQAVTNTRYDWIQFGTGSAEVLYLLNGADPPLIYDGTTWYSITTVSAPYALTGGPSPLSSLNQVARYKSRLWFVQSGTFNVYYLPQNVFAGALTLINMAPNFQLGGYLQLIATVSIDNAAGLSDYIAFISNQGEVVVFQGYDPAQVATWYETAHFHIGRPLAVGRRSWQKVGSDAFILCADGVIPLSKALVTDRSQIAIAISDKIRKAINDDVALYGKNTGWQILLHPEGIKLILNVPTVTNSTGYQYVQNTVSGAWCTFGKLASSWNPFCFEELGDNLYFSGNGIVAQCDTGSADGTSPILTTAKPAFSYMGEHDQLKQFAQCQLIFQASTALTASTLLNIDFDQTTPTNTVPLSGGTATQWGALWGSLWGDATQIVKPWVGVSGAGYSASLQLQISAKNITAKWQSTKYIFKTGGLFYG